MIHGIRKCPPVNWRTAPIDRHSYYIPFHECVVIYIVPATAFALQFFIFLMRRRRIKETYCQSIIFGWLYFKGRNFCLSKKETRNFATTDRKNFREFKKVSFRVKKNFCEGVGFKKKSLNSALHPITVSKNWEHILRSVCVAPKKEENTKHMAIWWSKEIIHYLEMSFA